MSAHQEYRQEWVRAGYDKDMGSAWVTLPPPPDRLRAYHFTTTEFALSNIALSRLKVARISEVNDPFELLGINFGARGVRHPTRNFKAEHNAQTGLLSFSRNWTNPVLWSHYAAKHKGICLAELDASGGDPNRIDPQLQERLKYTKFAHWGYEEEVRRFLPLEEMVKEGSLYFWPFSEELRLAEVILGTECDVDLATVRTLADKLHSGVVTIKSRLAFKYFAIVPDERTIP
jgi:hypothetical protein